MKLFRSAILGTSALVAITATSEVAFAQTPSNEELYRIVLQLKSEQDKLRAENQKMKAETQAAQAEVRRLQGEQKAVAAKVNAVAAQPAPSAGSFQVAKAQGQGPCASYGPGYAQVGNSKTCVKIGGYVRAEAQYTPQQSVYTLTEVNQIPVSPIVTPKHLAMLESPQGGNTMDTVGTEGRGRIDFEAVTPTEFGDARLVGKLRLSSLTGTRTATITNNAEYTFAPGVQLKAIPEAAYLSVGGFTMGIAPSNYALMPTSMYTGTPWTQYTNGVFQVSYKYDLGSGWSATGAIERGADWAYNMSVNRPPSAFYVVGNTKWEQNWGWLALQGVLNTNPLETADADVWAQAPAPLDQGTVLYGADASGYSYKVGGAIGVTANVKLPQLGKGDQLWLTANYANGNIGALLAAGGLSNISTQNNGSLFGGILRVDQNMMVVSGNGQDVPYTFKSVQGFNLAAMLSHQWSDRWRSNFNVGYVQIDPPKSAASDPNAVYAYIPQWGRGQLYSTAASLIYSVSENFDVGVEAAYAYLKNDVQNTPATWEVASNTYPYHTTGGSGTLPGLSQGNAILKTRAEWRF
jgi:hypothetical protein